MYYKPPITDNRPKYVPIVVKSKDYLAGYLHGMNIIKYLVRDLLEENGLITDFKGLDLCIDSTRFNNILEDGKREYEHTQDELKKYYHDLIKNKLVKIKANHPDDQKDVLKNYILTIECPYCGYGVYSFKNLNEIPEGQFKCRECGNVLIDYTNHYDEEFQYDKGDVK